MQRLGWMRPAGCALITLAVVAIGGQRVSGKRDAPSAPPAKTFDGSSSELKQTVIVPTLDTPMPSGKSVVWCTSFEMAWRALEKDVVKAPVRVEGAEDVATRLHAAQPPVLPPKTAYATAGIVTPDFLQGIRKEMRRRFPRAPAPSLDGISEGILAYAYLAANVSFRIPFFENHEPLNFQGASGDPRAVRSFGLREKDEYAYYKLRSQIGVLHAAHMFDGEGSPEFIIDPDVTSKPFQIVLARIDPAPTLADALKRMKEKIEATRKREYQPDFGPNDTLLVPELHWRITHHFSELEGTDKRLLNEGFQGYWIDQAMQTIEFRLDKSGADLKSEAKLHAMPIPSHFVFDRPFLIVMQKRGDAQPFFAMWVDNPELLMPLQEGR